MYMETHGIDPSDSDDLYNDIEEIAIDTIEQLDNLAEKYQELSDAN